MRSFHRVSLVLSLSYSIFACGSGDDSGSPVGSGGNGGAGFSGSDAAAGADTDASGAAGVVGGAAGVASGAAGDASSPDASAGSGGDDGNVTAQGGNGGAPSDPPVQAKVIAAVGASDIALGGGFVYFTDEATIGRVPIAGGPVESVFSKFTTAGPFFIDADDTRIVWTERNANTVFGAVKTCPLSGCGTAPTELPRKGESSNAISVDGDLVVWSSATNRTVYSTGTFGIQSPGTTLVDVVAEGGDVFWLDGGLLAKMGAVYSCPATGTCTPLKLGGDVGHPTRLAVHGDHVVVVSDTGVFHLSRDGSAMTRLAEGSAVYNVDVVTDGTLAYWALGNNLYGCKLSACTPVLADTSTGVSGGLEMDAAHVYWGTSTSIRRIDL